MAKQETIHDLYYKGKNSSKHNTQRQNWPNKWPSENHINNFHRENPYWIHYTKYIKS